MGAKLEALLELQQIEQQIVDIRRQLARKHRLVKRQSKSVRELQESLESEKHDLKRAQMQVDEVDLELKGRNANVTRLREQLNLVKTNKEYAAVLAELNNEKADVKRLEDRAYELMAGMEARKEGLAARKASEQSELQRLEDLKQQAGQTDASFAPTLKELEAKREKAIELLDAETQKLFSRLSERYEGEVLAEVDRAHPRRDEFTCGGCYMSVSAEAVNTLLVKDEVVTCPNCGRILYAEKGI